MNDNLRPAVSDTASENVNPAPAATHETAANLETRASVLADSKPTEPNNFPDIDGYEIIGVLGSGGMGVVYKAINRKLSRIVAIKMLHAAAMRDQDALQRFETEVRAISALRHSNIVQVLAAGKFNERPYYVMEFVDGVNLDVLMRSSPQTPIDAARMVITLAEAIEFCHQHQLLHRDLKPSNVMIVDGKHPKITDFGLAKSLSGPSNQTRTGEIMGTPGYMAPEQAGGVFKGIGPECDVYGLGAILYKLLTGRAPFDGSDPVETIMSLLTDDPIPPTKIVPGLPLDLETICLKCLAKQPGKRYRTAVALAQDLTRFIEHRPIHARPSRQIERISKWARRNPVAASSILSVSLLIAIFVGGVLWHTQRLNRSLAQTQNLVNYSSDLSSWIIRNHLGELSELSGSTQLNLQLISRLQGYLEGAKQDAQSNPTFLRRLGVAYETIGDVLGNPFQANMGRTRDSLGQYEIALEYYERANELAPNTPETVARLASCTLKIANVTTELDGVAASQQWLDKAENWVATYRQLDRSDLIQLDKQRIETKYWVAVAANEFQQANAFLDEFEQLLDAASRDWMVDEAAERYQLWLMSARCKNLVALEQYDDAVLSLTKLSDDLKERSQNRPFNSHFRDWLAVTRIDLADCYVMQGKIDEAHDLYENALAYRQGELREDPESAFSIAALALVYERIARLHQHARDHENALEVGLQSRQLRMQLFAIEPDNREFQRNLVIARQVVADSYFFLQKLDLAKVEFEECLKTIEPLTKTDQPQVSDLECLASSYQGLAGVSFMFWLQRPPGMEVLDVRETDDYKTAAKYYAQCLQTFQKIDSISGLTPRQQRLKTAAEKLRQELENSADKMNAVGSGIQ